MTLNSGIDLTSAAEAEQREINKVRAIVLNTKLDEEHEDNTMGVVLSAAQQAVARLTSSR